LVDTTRYWALLALSLWAALTASSALADSSARVARTTISTNESIQITFESDQDVTGEPDFSALQDDFDILGTSKGSNIDIRNGRMQRSTRWVLEVMPKREGTLVVPAINLGNESTEAINLTVTAQPSRPNEMGGEINLEVDVNKLAPYVQSQIIFTVRIVHTVSFEQASLTEPTLATGDALIEKLGEDIAYETQRGQQRLAIIERRYAIFPQNSGPLTIAPLRFESRVSTGRQSRFDAFGYGRVVRRQTEAIDIEIQPIPAAFSGSTWLPAKQLMLIESSPEQNPEYRVGEPFTRILTLQATGLSASQLPEVNATMPTTVKQYPDRPILENRVSSDDIIGTRQEKIALIPEQPGPVTLPSIKIPWWNTETDQLEYATLPTRTIEVAPALGSANAAMQPPLANASPLPQTASDSGGSDDDNNQAGSTPAQPSASRPGFWPWLSLALGLCWLATLFVWLRSRQRLPGAIAPDNNQPTEKQVLQALQSACETHDANAAKKAALQWATLTSPGNRIQSLGGLAAQFDGELQLELHRLSQHLYAQPSADWNGDRLWLSFAARPQSKVTTVASRQELEPLYRTE